MSARWRASATVDSAVARASLTIWSAWDLASDSSFSDSVLAVVGQPVGGVLGKAEHAGRLEVLVLAHRGGLRLRRGRLVDGRRDRLGFGLRLIQRDGLRRLRLRSPAGARGRQLLIHLGHPLTKVGVLLDEPGQLVLDQIEEGVDLVLVVAALADGWLAERDVVDVGWSERHCLPPRWSGPSIDLKV